MKKRKIIFMIMLSLCVLLFMPTQVSAKKIGKYSGKGVKIAVYQLKYKKITYFAAHVKLSKGYYYKMHLAKAKGKKSAGFQYVSTIAKKNHAILAINGPFNGADSTKWNAYGDKKYHTVYHCNYYEICNGVHYNGTVGTDLVGDGAAWSAATGILCPANQQAGVTSGMTYTQAAQQKLISDTFQGEMGLTILKNGKVLGAKGAKRQRSCFGTNGKAGDVWMVVNNGTMKKGFDFYDCGTVLKKLGCTYGFTMDGGVSATMVFKGKKLTSSKARTTYDALVVSK